MGEFLSLLHRQQEVCSKYHLPEAAPEAMVAVALSTIGKMPVYGTRIAIPPKGNISWFLHCGEYSDVDDFYKPLHSDHLAAILPLVLPYLRLPPGARFIIDDKGYEDVWVV